MAARGPRTVAAILVAGGSGQRLGADVPKAFVTVSGATLIEHALARFTGRGIAPIVVVVPPSQLSRAQELVDAVVVAGGATRQLSVAAGLASLGHAELVLVHDVARPFVPGSVIDAVLAALTGGADAVVPVLGIHDTIRRVDPDGSLGAVIDRSTLVAVQTPQGFRREVLAAAHAAGAGAGLTVTDDAGLVEAMGVRVCTVPGAEESFKITTAADLVRAEGWAGAMRTHDPLVRRSVRG